MGPLYLPGTKPAIYVQPEPEQKPKPEVKPEPNPQKNN